MASTADMLEPVDTSARHAADRRDQRAAGRRLSAATAAVAPAPPRLDASRRCASRCACTDRRLGGRSFLGCRIGAAAARDADHADAATTRSSRCCRRAPAIAAKSGERARRLAARPDDPALALAVAQRYLEQARESGDPRFAGLALAALRAWTDAATRARRRAADAGDAAAVPARVRRRGRAPATAARAAGQRAQPQAWLTLATVLRVQGRYAESDARLSRGRRRRRRPLHGARAWPRTRRCAATSAGARAASRPCWRARRCRRRRGWLTTSLAELEERDGRAAAADAAFRAVLRARARTRTRRSPMPTS